MSKHTPGPWVILGDNVGCKTGHVAFTTCNPRTIDETKADGESWLDMRDRTKTERDGLAKEVAANARLIAAAPDLLEALEAIVESVDAETAAIFEHLVWAARAAIAKATGEPA